MSKKVLAGTLALAAMASWPVAATGHAPDATGSMGATTATASGGVQHLAWAGGTTGGHVVVEGNRLYMGMYGVGLRIFDIADPAAPREMGTWEPADSLARPRLVADAPPDAAVFDGRHIAVVNGTSRTSRSLPQGDARTDNTYFLDTTDPAKARLLWTFEGAHDGESHNGDIVDERRLWLPSGGRNTSDFGDATQRKNGLRIYDLNPLLQVPPAAPKTLFRGDPVELWATSPHNPKAGTEGAGGPGFTHTHDITVYPDFEFDGRKRDIALLAEGGDYASVTGNTGSLFVIDITDPQAPVVLQRWRHAAGEGHHPIRYYHEAQFLDGDPRVVLVTDEDLHNGCNAGGSTALRLSEDLTSATELSEWFIGYDPAAGRVFGPVCSVHVFSSHGNLVFFGSYNAGLQVVDYSNPAEPRLVGHNVQLGADSWGAQYLRDGIVYVGDFGARGLDVFRYAGPRPDLVAGHPELQESRRKDRPSTLTARVHNDGDVTAPPTVLELRDGDALIAREQIPALAPQETHAVSVAWETRNLKGSRTVTSTADADDRVDEVDETNNTASSTFRLRGRP